MLRPDGRETCYHTKFPYSGSEYFKYQGTHSIILLASVHADYCFHYFNGGTNGWANDAVVLTQFSLNPALEDVGNRLNFQKNGVFVADHAFPLRIHFLKPFGRSTNLSRKPKIVNYRLSRARRLVENAFGILVSRFKVFERPIAIDINNLDEIIKVTLTLHKWLKINFNERYTPLGSSDKAPGAFYRVLAVGYDTSQCKIIHIK